MLRHWEFLSPQCREQKQNWKKKATFLNTRLFPNFNKIGYHLFALTFFSWKHGISSSEMERAIKLAQEKALSVPSNIVLIERGIGLGYNSFMGSFHRDYSSYTKLLSEMKKSPYVDLARMESFIVDLDDEIHYRALTFSTLAKHLLETNQKKE